MEALFAPYGEIASLRIVRASRMGAATKTFAFVKYANVNQARAAIAALHGTAGSGGGGNGGSVSSGGGALEVKFADADAGDRNPELSAPPSDNLYCKNLPGTFTDDELRALFRAHGGVIECKLLHRGDSTQVRRAGARGAVAFCFAILHFCAWSAVMMHWVHYGVPFG